MITCSICCLYGIVLPLGLLIVCIPISMLALMLAILIFEVTLVSCIMCFFAVYFPCMGTYSICCYGIICTWLICCLIFEIIFGPCIMCTFILFILCFPCLFCCGWLCMIVLYGILIILIVLCIIAICFFPLICITVCPMAVIFWPFTCAIVIALTTCCAISLPMQVITGCLAMCAVGLALTVAVLIGGPVCLFAVPVLFTVFTFTVLLPLICLTILTLPCWGPIMLIMLGLVCVLSPIVIFAIIAIMLMLIATMAVIVPYRPTEGEPPQGLNWKEKYIRPMQYQEL